jgi:hypothetical protein
MSLVANPFVTAAPVLRKRKSVDDDVHSIEYSPFTRAIKQPRRLERYQMDSDHVMSLPSFEPASSVMNGTSPSPSAPVSAESSPSSEYPLFQLYPDAPDPNAMDVDNAPSPDSVTSQQEPVGVLGLQSFGEQHSRCTQLPRLQVANYPGLEGQRVMYSRCMQCGGISQLPNH